MEKALRTFLSVQNIDLHKEYLRQLRLKYSILEKSIPMLKGAELADIPRLGIKVSEREEALLLKLEIMSHEIYFSSFTDKYQPCPIAAKHYGTENNFVYEVYKTARELGSGFLFISLDSRGKPVLTFAEGARAVIPKYQPILAIDLFEHASFLDYGFERERYIENAAAHLNLSKLTEYAQRH